MAVEEGVPPFELALREARFAGRERREGRRSGDWARVRRWAAWEAAVGAVARGRVSPGRSGRIFRRRRWAAVRRSEVGLAEAENLSGALFRDGWARSCLIFSALGEEEGPLLVWRASAPSPRRSAALEAGAAAGPSCSLIR